MKRVLTVLFLLSLLSVIAFKDDFTNLNNSHITKVCVVSQQEIDEGFDRVVKSGNDFFYLFSCDYDVNIGRFSQISGINLYFTDYSLEEIIKDYHIDYFKGKDVEDYQIYYGFTNLFKRCLNIDNKKVNVQIAANKQQIIVGFPCILTGF